MKQYFLGVLTTLATIIIVLSIVIFSFNKKEKIEKDNNSKMLSMLVENDKGEYELSKDNHWPEGYVLNEELSKCENGSTLKWNDDTKTVTLSTNKTDKCYVYFDKYSYTKDCLKEKIDSFACDIIQLAQTDEAIIYHNLEDATKKAFENYSLVAEDDSYRYTGASNKVNNYVCLDGKKFDTCESDADLYRIIGLFKNEENQYEIKLIKANAATTTELGDLNYHIDGDNTPSAYKVESRYYWNSSNGPSDNNNINIWQYSNLNKVNLNSHYLSYLSNKIPNITNQITKHKWNTGGGSAYLNTKDLYNMELGNSKIKVGDNNCYDKNNINNPIPCTKDDIEFNGKIGLLYISDYGYSAYSKAWKTKLTSNDDIDYSQAEIKDNNWLYSGLYEWTISRVTNIINYAYIIYGSDNDTAGSILPRVINSAMDTAVRPVFYLNSNVKLLSGNGSKDNPYRLSV